MKEECPVVLGKIGPARCSGKKSLCVQTCLPLGLRVTSMSRLRVYEGLEFSVRGQIPCVAFRGHGVQGFLDSFGALRAAALQWETENASPPSQEGSLSHCRQEFDSGVPSKTRKLERLKLEDLAQLKELLSPMTPQARNSQTRPQPHPLMYYLCLKEAGSQMA